MINSTVHMVTCYLLKSSNFNQINMIIKFVHEVAGNCFWVSDFVSQGFGFFEVNFHRVAVYKVYIKSVSVFVSLVVNCCQIFDISLHLIVSQSTSGSKYLSLITQMPIILQILIFLYQSILLLFFFDFIFSQRFNWKISHDTRCVSLV